MMNPPDLTTLETPALEAPAATAGISSRTEPPANLEAAIAAVELEAPPAAPGAPGGPPAPLVMPRAEWCDLYLKCHGIAGNFMGSGVLESVPKRAGGPEAAGAVYDTILDTPALHFLIAPGGIWFQRAATVLLFYGPIVGELRHERAAAIARSRRPPAVAPAPPIMREGELVAGAAYADGGLAMPPAGAQ